MNKKLASLARLYGVQTFYSDMKKRRRDAAEESIILALRALGARIEGISDAGAALSRRQDEIAERTVEPVMLAWDGELDTRQKNLPRKAELRLENGDSSQWPPRSPLPPGYHELSVTRGGRTEHCLVLSAPTRAHFPLSGKTWGVFAPIYALHSERTRGGGDLTDFRAVFDWVRALGGQVAATLPLLANFLEKPFEPSPYSPVSRLFWNEFYIDPSLAPEFAQSPKARQLLEKIPGGKTLVDYKAIMAAKKPVIRAMANQFFSRAGSARRAEFDSFLKSKPEVSDYGRFRAVTERQGKGWTQWPERLQSGGLRAGDWDEDALQYHLYAQWIAHQQMKGLARHFDRAGGVLYLDLPLGLHPDSYDTWKYPEFFVNGMATGAPPDPVFTTGQNWGFPPMHPDAMRTNRYGYTRAYLRNHFQYARLLRIDHVMGLHRLYWIPEGLSGDKGLYVSYPAEEMYAIFSIESHRHRAGVFGENLGVVPAEVNRGMALHNIHRLYVAQYETVVGPGSGGLRPPPADVVASLNTHDMFPFQAFLEGADIDDRMALQFLSAKEAAAERKQRAQVRKALSKPGGRGAPDESVLERCLNFMARSKAGVVLVNLEDLWHEKKPQNIPATTDERPNWRRRMRYSIERLRKSKEASAVLKNLNTMRKTRPS